MNALHLTIRHGVESDLEAIKCLADANREMLGFVLRPALAAGIAHRWVLVAQACHNDAILGFVHYRHRRDHQSTVYELCVQAGHRGQGIGRALLQALSEEASGQEQTSLFLKTVRDSAANGFYAHVGFVGAGSADGKKRPLVCWRLPLAHRNLEGAHD